MCLNKSKAKQKQHINIQWKDVNTANWYFMVELFGQEEDYSSNGIAENYDKQVTFIRRRRIRLRIDVFCK